MRHLFVLLGLSLVAGNAAAGRPDVEYIVNGVVSSEQLNTVFSRAKAKAIKTRFKLTDLSLVVDDHVMHKPMTFFQVTHRRSGLVMKMSQNFGQPLWVEGRIVPVKENRKVVQGLLTNVSTNLRGAPTSPRGLRAAFVHYFRDAIYHLGNMRWRK